MFFEKFLLMFYFLLIVFFRGEPNSISLEVTIIFCTMLIIGALNTIAKILSRR